MSAPAQEEDQEDWEDVGPFDESVFDDGAVEEPFFPPSRRRPEPPDEATRTADKPLTNKEAIPLFPGSDKSQARKGKQIKVTKLDPPNHGVKGKIPLGSDEEFIAQRWGDGTYTLDVINAKGVSLQQIEAVRIAFGYDCPESDEGEETPTATGVDANETIRQLNVSHAQERARSGQLHADLLKRTSELANAHTKMVMDSTDKAAAREEKFFEAGQTRTEKFFETILSSTTAAHEREMARTQTESAATLERIRVDNEHKEAMNEQRHVQLMEIVTGAHKRELEMVEAGNDEDPGVKMLSEGVKGLKELRLAAQTAGGRRVPRSARQPGRKRLRRGSRDGGEKPAQTRENRKSSSAAKEYARNLAALKRDCDNKGIDFADLIDDARQQVQEHPGLDREPDNEPDQQSGDKDGPAEDGSGHSDP